MKEEVRKVIEEERVKPEATYQKENIYSIANAISLEVV